MADYRVFVAKLNTEKDAGLIAYLENQTIFVDWVRDHARADMRQVGIGPIVPAPPGGETCDATAIASIVRATVVGVLDEKFKGAILATAGADPDTDLDDELGDKLDSMEF